MILLSLLLALQAAAQEPSFELRFSSPTAQLAESVSLEAAAKLPPGASLSLDMAASSTDSYRITGARDMGVKDGVQTFLIDVVPLAFGKIPVILRWDYLGGLLSSPPAVLEVPEPPPDPHAQLRDIKSPRTARPALWPWLLLAACAVAAWLAYKRFRRKTSDAKSADPGPHDDRPAHVRAQAELSALESSGLWPEHRYKEYYIRLTDILRQYLDGRFGIPAQHLTTTELNRQMRQAEIDRRAAGMVKEIFDRADLVKFAKIVPEEGSGAQDIQYARGAVQETAPREAPAQAAAS